MSVSPVNLTVLRRVFALQVAQRIPYRLGGKAPTLGAEAARLASGIDCSGFARLVLHQASAGKLTLPDGSWNQRAWCEENLEEVPYSTALGGAEGELFIAFITAKVRGAGRVGHVWLVQGKGKMHLATTMESYGGHGIGARVANTPVLLRQVHKCFRVPTTAPTHASSPLVRTAAPIASREAPTLYLNDVALPSARLENGHYLAPVRDVLRALELNYSPDAEKTKACEFRLKVWK